MKKWIHKFLSKRAANLVKHMRTKENLTQRELADQLGVDLEQIARIESGKSYSGRVYVIMNIMRGLE